MKIAKVISEQEGLSPEKAQEVWDAFEKFGGYAFNKSHRCLLADQLSVYVVKDTLPC